MSETTTSHNGNQPLVILRALFRAMRPRQWPKNGFVFAALIFDGQLFSIDSFLRTVAAFVCFCAVSSAGYLINDLADIEKDRQHPTKRLRPLAAGILPPWVAVAAAVVLMAVCLPAAYRLDSLFSAILLGYLALTLSYTFYLKHIVIVDLIVVAAGFVLRVAGGVAVIRVARFSPWMYVCMGLLALFMIMGKRRHELNLLTASAASHRAILEDYTVRFLDEMIAMVTASLVMAYSLYTFSAPNMPANHAMMLTIPFVIYGLFRYLYLIHVQGQGGAPEELLLRDWPLLIDVVLWVAVVIAALYFWR
ncbi:MAG: decaprenyl-phosphate phosphoribosyltransferase [Anaerolineae bacterium]